MLLEAVGDIWGHLNQENIEVGKWGAVLVTRFESISGRKNRDSTGRLLSLVVVVFGFEEVHMLDVRLGLVESRRPVWCYTGGPLNRMYTLSLLYLEELFSQNSDILGHCCHKSSLAEM